MSDAASTDLNDCAFDYPAFLRAHEEAARQKSSANLVPCRAPMVMLVIDPDGEARPCEYSHRALREPPETSLKDIWTGEDIGSLRTSITAKTLPQDHCRHCATCFSAGKFLHAPALHAYSNLQAPEDLKDPKTIVCRLPEKGVWNVSLLGQLPGLFAKADLVTLEADSPLTNPTGTQLLAMIRGLSRHDRPKVSVRAKILPEVEEARDLLRDIRLTGIEIRYQKDLEPELQKASQLCEGEIALSTKMLIDQDSWFDLVRVANICTENNAKLNICVTTNQGLMPLARLPLEEMFAVHSMIASWWPLMEEGCRPASLDPAAFTLLTEELRNGILSLSQMAVNDDAVSIVAGRGARFLLPEPDHSFFDADSIASVMGVPAHLCNSPSVLDWIRGQARAPESAKLAATHPWFRTLLQKLLIESPLPERSATTILRKLYGTPRGRKQILDEDREFATKIHTQGWCELLGLDRPLKRTPPFKIGEPIEPTTDDLKKADVTVLVPSFRHEEWIEQTLRSVLAQTYSRFKLLIVDDCSPDNTAKKARSLKDPRIKVQINETGLGLGSSMLGALDDIDTPYVAVLNSDDLFHPERLERCLAILKNSSSVHLVSTGISLIDANSEELTPENASQVLDGKNISDWVQWFDAVRPSPDETVSFENLLGSNVLASSSNMVCRTDFLRSLADEIKGLKYCVDWQTFLRASIDGSLHYIHDPLLAYRLHTGNTVWFERDHRWDYFLEANRVAARNLRYFFTRPGEHPDDQKLTSILNIMVSHLESNDELFGSALYINELFADLDIAEIAQNNPQTKAFLKRLELTCQEAQSITKHINLAGWRAQDILPQLHWIPTLRANKVLAQALEDDLSATKGSQEWFRGYAHELETKVGEHWERHGRDEA
ncbi:MAG: glycosyltransferase, partial [Planctomycetota bacterium]|nr:glycosyltransferase [Planctomycetota bacterium]